MKKLKLFLSILLMASAALCVQAQDITYHYVVKDLGLKAGDVMPGTYKPLDCKDMIQISYNRNSGDEPYFDGENAVCPASNDGGPKGTLFNVILTEYAGDYVIKDLEVILANNKGTNVQCIITNDYKRIEEKGICQDAYTWTNEKLREFTLINNGPESFSVKEVILTISTFQQADTCALKIPYKEGFENSVKLHNTLYPNSCWDMYQSGKNSMPTIIGLMTGASYVYDGNFELDMRETPDCWNVVALPAVQEGTDIKNLVVDLYAEAVSSMGTLEVGVLPDPEKPESFVSLHVIKSSELQKTWYHVIAPLNKYNGTGKRIAIRTMNMYNGAIHIDNLSVNEIGTTPAPYHVVAENANYKQIKVDWKDVYETKNWEVVLVEHGAALSTGKSYPVTAHPAIIDVEANHNYDVYVKAVYGTGTSELSEPDSIHVYGCPEAERCTYTVTWKNDQNLGSLNNMIRVYINGFLADYLSMPAGVTTYENYINVCKGDEVRLAFKRGSNYTRVTNFTITDPDNEVICKATTGVLNGKQCQNGDAIMYMTYDNPFLSFVGECSACKAPKNLAATNITTNSADICWDAPAAATSMTIEYGEQGFIVGQGEKVEVTSSPFTLENLTSGTEYDLYIYSNCGEETSKKSDVLIFSTAADCMSPVNFTARIVSAAFVTFTWEAGDGETEWEVCYLRPNETEYTEPVKVTEPTITVDNLMNESSYTFRLRAICGEGKYSAWVKRTVKTTQCKAPTNVKITNIGSREATVTWMPANYESKWLVSYKDNDATQWTMKIVTESTLVLTDLKPNTVYSLHVEAFCSDDIQSDPTTDAFFTTKTDGIEDYMNNAIVLYPSYADDVLNVYINDARVQASRIEVYDMNGRLLQSCDAQGENTQISVAQLSAGMYMVRIQSNQGSCLKKFIKK